MKIVKFEFKFFFNIHFSKQNFVFLQEIQPIFLQTYFYWEIIALYKRKRHFFNFLVQYGPKFLHQKCLNQDNYSTNNSFNF